LVVIRGALKILLIQGSFLLKRKWLKKNWNIMSVMLM